MRKISRQHNEITKAFAAARDVWDVLDEDEILPEKPNAVELKTLQNKIELKNVGFHYQNKRKNILKNVNLEIPKGENDRARRRKRRRKINADKTFAATLRSDRRRDFMGRN